MDDRQLLNAMVFRGRTGITWQALPERHGPWQTVSTRFRRRATDGVFDRLLAGLQARTDAAGAIDWLVSLDSTIIRAQDCPIQARSAGACGTLASRSRC